jgi:hypothetical protein
MCDTRAEAERFVALFNGDAPAKTGIETALASEAASSATSATLCFESLMWASHQRVSHVLHLMG